MSKGYNGKQFKKRLIQLCELHVLIVCGICENTYD